MSELVRDWKLEKKDLEEAFDIIADKLVKADAEIERLKAEGPWQQIKCPYCLKEHSYKPSRIIREQKALITELCDALDRSDPIQISIQEVAALIQRAREATR